jgi:hypothetical protein
LEGGELPSLSSSSLEDDEELLSSSEELDASLTAVCAGCNDDP